MTKQIGIIIYFRLEGQNAKERTGFCRKFWGYVDRSCFGRYVYQREGFMSKVPHIHVSCSLLIILEKDLDVVKEFCDKFGVTLLYRRIELEEDDREALFK